MLGFAVAPWGFADSEFPAQIQTNVLLTFHIYLISSNILVTNMIFVSTYFDISKMKSASAIPKNLEGKGRRNWVSFFQNAEILPTICHQSLPEWAYNSISSHWP